MTAAWGKARWSPSVWETAEQARSVEASTQSEALTSRPQGRLGWAAAFFKAEWIRNAI